MSAALRLSVLAAFATVLCAPSSPAPPTPSVYAVRTADSSPHNWGLLLHFLCARALVAQNSEGRLPPDLAPYRLVIISTNLQHFLPDKERLWQYVRDGGKLVFWFPDDRRTDPAIFPYKLRLSDDDPPTVQFASSDHPLLRDLAGRQVEGRMMGGDVAAQWDPDHWQILATTPRGPALLRCDYGKGEILDVQFHAPLSSTQDVIEPFARNLAAWAKLPRVQPGQLRERGTEQVLRLVADRLIQREPPRIELRTITPADRERARSAFMRSLRREGEGRARELSRPSAPWPTQDEHGWWRIDLQRLRGEAEAGPLFVFTALSVRQEQELQFEAYQGTQLWLDGRKLAPPGPAPVRSGKRQLLCRVPPGKRGQVWRLRVLGAGRKPLPENRFSLPGLRGEADRVRFLCLGPLAQDGGGFDPQQPLQFGTLYRDSKGEPTTWRAVSNGAQVRCVPVGASWNYPWGVALYGLVRLSEVSGDASYAAFVQRQTEFAARHYDFFRWQRKALDLRYVRHGLTPLARLSSLDDCGSMGAATAEIALARSAARADGPGRRLRPDATHADRAVWRLLEQIADYILHRQSRLADGSLCRGRTLWIDDLYMSVPFLARMGTLTGQSEYYDDAARQIINFARRLQDRDGLWFHGWDDRQQRHSPYKWGRGNGWAILAEAETLRHLPPDYPARAQLLDIYRRHLQGLLKVQAPSGMWRQVLDEPDLWEETSCTGMFAYALALAANEGWGGPEHLAAARRAWTALKGQVTWDGMVVGTCVGTGIGWSLKYYRRRPRTINDPHGHGPLLLAGCEILRADQTSPARP